jgi:hypothetical protein
MRSTNRIELLHVVDSSTRIAKKARFTFNCYKHWSTLIRATTMAGSFLYRGVAGDPLSMFAYGIPTLIHFQRFSFQRWIRPGTRMMQVSGKFDAIKRHFEKLEEIGPNFSYFPEPSKHLDRVSENFQLRWKL